MFFGLNNKKQFQFYKKKLSLQTSNYNTDEYDPFEALVSTYCFIPVCQATAIIMLTQVSTGTISAIAVALPNIVRSIPLPV
jgi:hypothetical protein